MNLAEISSLLNIPCHYDIHLSGIGIDSRTVEPGHLFVAVRGERFDGHDFIREAVLQGAAAVLCTNASSMVDVPQLTVADTIQSLATIAAYYRQQFSCGVVALTGSNGKTTVKEMIAAILPKPSHATPGNLNNHIGVPLSVLKLRNEHHYAVFELGANHPGEIAKTVVIVQPHVTLINNIAPAHIQGFGSIEGVAKAKGEIHQGLNDQGVAVINDDDSFAHYWDALLVNKRVLRFSMDKPAAAIHARQIDYDEMECARFILVVPDGEVEIQLKVPGAHNVKNALAAAACTYALGIGLSDIASGLCQFSGVSGRMTYRSGKNNSVIVDDTYNANLRSVIAALEVLAKYRGRRILILGDMGELGESTKSHHEEIGRVARRLGIDAIMTYGHHSQYTSQIFGSQGRHYDSQETLVDELLNQLNSNTMVLVKGSRAAAMEKVVHQLL
ncbi:UDP-N-acetylmuramoyl-tripeptide--D-alanyl-D-alanine ligase [Legionella nagasakiensis]|uniref:UDP-N-acetylmuramoyl-tripeptide--D-alanyl-D- alanine ligase n=1 Tax=Legionella nagasakiensis TaxID=535290 RepID=UPI001055A7E6|nr:UDP-N-acetylmuramoyl-tripeptide--D-alanyl-D-alanine ligase [Legionella nagasakiensis]